MAKAKKKAPGRPPGAAGKKSEHLRDQVFTQMRCSRGFNKVVEELVTLGLYKSKADVMHEALQQLAYKKLDATFYWINKIQ